MNLKVLYFASIREKVERSSEEIDVAVSSVAELREHLRARGGVWAEALAEGKLLRTAVNQDMVQGTAQLKAGDEVAFFPPVTGG